MTRQLMRLGWEINPVDIEISSTDGLINWLLEHAEEGDFLLVHAVDGVIWGQISNNQLRISHEFDPTISPQLRLETLQQLRLFNASREFLLWHDGIAWQARNANDFSEDSGQAVLEECHILWGTKGTLFDGGFTLLEDGAQGLRHIVPIDASKVNERNIRACMKVHYFLNLDPDLGTSSITYSRLAGLEVVTYG